MPNPDNDPAELLSLAKVVQAKVDEACPDQDPLKMRAVALLVGEAYLQAAALDKTIADYYRRPPNK
ncbi:hypothetical protein [Roseobacter phage RDJL3]|jgi:hypothetical protein|nr:hypothetical protein [Roseobacter phage RDJL3]